MIIASDVRNGIVCGVQLHRAIWEGGSSVSFDLGAPAYVQGSTQFHHVTLACLSPNIYLSLDILRMRARAQNTHNRRRSFAHSFNCDPFHYEDKDIHDNDYTIDMIEMQIHS